MSKSLETIATFDNLPEAHIAKNCLAEEGIPAFFADETTVFMFGYLSNALGGIKLQVHPEHKELALDILHSTQPLDDSILLREANNSALSLSPLVEEDRGGEEVSEIKGDDAPADEPDIPLNAREELAERAYRAAALGLLFFPFEFYAAWQLRKVLLSELPLNPQARRHALIAAGLSLPIVTLAVCGLLYIL